MAKVRWIEAEPDDPMFKEGYRSYSPHWARLFLKSPQNTTQASPETTIEQKRQARRIKAAKKEKKK